MRHCILLSNGCGVFTSLELSGCCPVERCALKKLELLNMPEPETCWLPVALEGMNGDDYWTLLG